MNSPTLFDAYEHEMEVEMSDCNDEEIKEPYEFFNGSGRTVTLQMLMATNMLQPGKAVMTIEYLGQKFIGDLLSDGRIQSQETETVFLTPSAWAMHCKRIINPDKKSGCGWGSVKYKGKKLDSYKNLWLKKCNTQKEFSPSCNGNVDSHSARAIKRLVFRYNSIPSRTSAHDCNTLIEAESFSALGKLQPFILTVNSSALLLADFHCHLILGEACGYLGGSWNANTQILLIQKAYPCLNDRHDRYNACKIEAEVKKAMMKDELMLLGWYHSHPSFQADPTLRDCDSQLDYQLQMRGTSDVTYTPCISLIISTYCHDDTNSNSNMKFIWVAPPAETKQSLEYGRPMSLQYSLEIDNELREHIQTEMQLCVSYYKKAKNEMIQFQDTFYNEMTFLDKLKINLYPKFPANTSHKEVWNWICAQVDCEQETEFIPPQTAHFICETLVDAKSAANVEVAEKPSCDVKVMSLQEQLSMPSGLNMNPMRIKPNLTSTPQISTAPVPLGLISKTACGNGNNTDHNNMGYANDNNSDVISKTSKNTANSPAILGKRELAAHYDICKNVGSSASIVTSIPPSAETDLMTASITQLATQLTPNFLQSDIAFLLRQENADCGNSPLNQLTAVANVACEENSLKPAPPESNISDNEHITSDVKECTEVNSNKSFVDDWKLRSSSDVYTKNASEISLDSKFCTYSNKTKPSNELDKLKNESTITKDFAGSPEYATLLLQQAEALGATTLGTLGLNADINLITATGLQSASEDTNGRDKTFSKSGSVNSADPISTFNNFAQNLKPLDYDTVSQNRDTPTDLNTVHKKKISTGTVSQDVCFNNDKYQSNSTQVDYTALLQAYSKLLETNNHIIKNSMNSNVTQGMHSFSADDNATSKQKSCVQSHVLHQLLHLEKQDFEIKTMYRYNKADGDLNTHFTTAVGSSNVTQSSPEPAGSPPQYSQYYNTMAHDKLPKYSNFLQHQDKYAIPDPLAKTTLAANKLFMSPSALLKIQQDSLSAMMMKPPKSTTPCSLRTRESAASPAQERITSTKLATHLQGSTSKYNFSAADLAVSSVPISISSSAASDVTTSSLIQRPSNTPPVDLSRLYAELGQTQLLNSAVSQKLEFSSIADLAAPPKKVSKLESNKEMPNLYHE